ncbi:Panacea domain-containing protein [Aurantivibrio plasticivorans]
MSHDTHSALSVAEYVLNKGRESDINFTPMQVIKLVYLCHGWMLGLLGRPLIDEEIEAWRYGPVVPSVYHAVKKYRSEPIPLDEKLSIGIETFDSDEKLIMDQVVNLYKGFNGLQLSQLTHESGTPWSQIWEEFGQNWTIPNGLITKHFSQLAHTRSSQQQTRAAAQ